MNSVLARVLVISALGALSAVGAGCAKSPTVVLTRVLVDDGVPPLLLLYATVVSTADPGQRTTESFVSLAPGDAGDRPAPYQFPLDLPVRVPVELAGPVTVTIEGRDWDRNVVTARGSTQASVVKEQQTSATVTLTAVSVPEVDGGLVGDGGADAADAGADGALAGN